MSTGINVGACALLVLLFGSPAHAETAMKKTRAAERAADAELASRERVCNTKFVVASCVEQARRDHRIKMADLRSEATALEEARRRSLADTRREAIADKLNARQAQARSEAQTDAQSPQAQAQSRAQGSSSGASESERRATPPLRPGHRKLDMAPLGPAGQLVPKRVPHRPVPKPSRSLLPSPSASSPRSAAGREASERLQRERFEKRDREIEAHKADILRRRADREAQGRLAAPLPLPPGASP